MRKQSMILAVALLLGLSAGCYAEPNSDSSTKPQDETSQAAGELGDDTLAVETATRDFYAALNRLLAGDASGMDSVWSQADDVTSMGPQGGIATGWPEVQALYVDAAQLKLGGAFQPEDLHTTVGVDLAIVECYEVGRYASPTGGNLPVRIRATNSFRKVDGQWKMIGHHTDLVPFLTNTVKPSQTFSSSNLSDPGDPADSDSIEVKGDAVLLKLEE